MRIYDEIKVLSIRNLVKKIFEVILLNPGWFELQYDHLEENRFPLVVRRNTSKTSDFAFCGHVLLEVSFLKKSRKIVYVVIENIFFALEKKIIKVVNENANTIKTNDFFSLKRIIDYQLSIHFSNWR